VLVLALEPVQGLGLVLELGLALAPVQGLERGLATAQERGLPSALEGSLFGSGRSNRSSW